METSLIIIGIILTIAGLAGSFIPVLPGPPLSYLALVCIQFGDKSPFTMREMILYGIIAIVITILDYIVPIYGTKKLGGSKSGVRGATIGLILGIFLFPPIGIIVGPFAGAVIGELLAGKKTNVALLSGFGSFLGFLVGTILKFAISGFLAWQFFKNII